MEKDIKDFIIEKLTELLIKTDIEDKQKGKSTYVKKTNTKTCQFIKTTY